jgi:hypothetical protein
LRAVKTVMSGIDEELEHAVAPRRARLGLREQSGRAQARRQSSRKGEASHVSRLLVQHWAIGHQTRFGRTAAVSGLPLAADNWTNAGFRR